MKHMILVSVLVSEITPKRCFFLQLGAFHKKCKILFVNDLQNFASYCNCYLRRLRDSNPNKN